MLIRIIVSLFLVSIMTSRSQHIFRKNRTGTRIVPGSEVLLEVLQHRIENSNETYFEDPSINNFSFIPRSVDFNTINKMIDAVVNLDFKSTRRMMQTRRQEKEPTWFLHLGKRYLTYLGDQIFDMMQQVIFGTRDRIKKLLPIREHYVRDIDYHIGINCGAVDQNINKLNRTYYTAYRYLNDTHFVMPFHYFLLMYQKHLAIYTDIVDSVERAFYWHDESLKFDIF